MVLPRLACFVIIALALGALGLLIEVGLPSGSPTSGNDWSRTSVMGYRVRIADSPAERAQGLSGTAPLPQGEGMLFIFERAGMYGFWMKDMNYPIDIIWLNDDLESVGATKNISPDTFPAVFYPPVPVRYVLEISSTKSPQ